MTTESALASLETIMNNHYVYFCSDSKASVKSLLHHTSKHENVRSHKILSLCNFP